MRDGKGKYKKLYEDFGDVPSYILYLFSLETSLSFIILICDNWNNA